MGVDLGAIIEKKQIDFEFLRGKIIAVDAYNMLYQFITIIRGADGMPLRDAKGRITSHLSGLLYRTANWLENEIKPVFVFDGKPSELKKKTIEERNAIRSEAEEKFKEALAKGDLEEARKFGQQAARLSKDIVESAKELISLMGLPYVQAPSEGEAQAAFMASKGDVYACASQDYDALLFGSPRLVRNLAITGKRKLPGKEIYIDIMPELIELNEITEKLKIDRKKLIWIGILIGTDFNEKFPGIGPKKALQLVQKYNSFEDIIKAVSYEPNFDYKAVEEIFLNPNVTEEYKIEFKIPEKEKLVRFLCDEHNFSEERVLKAVEKIETALSKKGTQSTLDAWF